MTLHLFMFHNGRGIVGLLLAVVLSWLIVFECLRGRDRDFFWVWMFLTSVWGSLTDRIEHGQSLRSYLRFVEVAMNVASQSHVDCRTRISVFGLPLVLAPFVGFCFSILFPVIDKNPLPPADYFWDGFICCVGSVLVFRIAGPLRRFPPKDTNTLATN